MQVIYRYERSLPPRYAWLAHWPPWLAVKWAFTALVLNYMAAAFLASNWPLRHCATVALPLESFPSPRVYFNRETSDALGTLASGWACHTRGCDDHDVVDRSCQHVFAYAQLLDFWPSIRAWADINFLGHILVCLLPFAQALVLHGGSTKKLLLASRLN